MKTYLLPCVCSADIPVGVGQAGGRVTCPACARDVDVPKLRLLGNLSAMAPVVQPVETRWGVAHGLTLCGVVLALLAIDQERVVSEEMVVVEVVVELDQAMLLML